MHYAKYIYSLYSKYIYSPRTPWLLLTEKKAIDSINSAIDGASADGLMSALKQPTAELGQVHDYAAPLYHEELRNMKNEKQALLDYEELYGGIKGAV